ncbi:hypothetical protein LCGC14_2706730, partial [marine sediment metagenome]
NIFIRPDWSKAKTRWSYSRFNTFTDALVSPDAELLDHEMMLAMFEGARLTGTKQQALDTIIEGLRLDKERELFIVSWGNLAPPHAAHFSEGAEEAFSEACGGREHLVSHFRKMMHDDPSLPAWDGSVPPMMPSGGVVSSDWGIVARNSRNGVEFRLNWSELPELTNPHDRVEMAERLEALIEEATEQRVTIFVQSILPWRGRVGVRHMSRADLTR